jgi:hypothetical protein
MSNVEGLLDQLAELHEVSVVEIHELMVSLGFSKIDRFKIIQLLVKEGLLSKLYFVNGIQYTYEQLKNVANLKVKYSYMG